MPSNGSLPPVGQIGAHRGFAKYNVTMDPGLKNRTDPSKVVLSFATKDGGAGVAMVLRQAIMQRKGYLKPDDVYMDSVALAQNPTSNVKPVDPSRGQGWKGQISLNDAWNQFYRQAIEECHTMIFIVSPEWTLSKWCKGELDHYEQVNWWRQSVGRKRIKGIALMWGGQINSSEIDVRIDISNSVSQFAGNIDAITDPMMIDRIVAAMGE